MFQLLFMVIFSEMAVIMVLSFKTPLRKLTLMVLDRVKRGRGPLMVKTVAATIAVVMISSVYSMMTIKKRWIDDGSANPTEQILMVKHLLEATLMGGVLFLALMIDRLHHYIRELRIRRKSMEAIKKQGPEDGKSSGSDKVKALEGEVTTLQAKLKQLESDLETKTKEMDAAEANAVALRKQSEGFLLEYDRLLEENQNLRNQLESLEQSPSRLGNKKNT
ncbi:hypothetical protein ES319_D10G012600v1 [Gossypium barbadense]|uniref:Endoplasmic reticulum transmembrane protein n=1 Tax=Gossypium barbadense TaxID=3634 RepID=A0A5J5PPT5_GOSBA|nr:hypothetical protein ES319_D10G012600v1 [Gossypium barbadense]PPD77942.1 hypothetical protein GOBAR_DD25114 [Gossypium barbadense]